MIQLQLLVCYVFVTVLRSFGLQQLNRFTTNTPVVQAIISADEKHGTDGMSDWQELLFPDLIKNPNVRHFVVKLDADTKSAGDRQHPSPFILPRRTVVNWVATHTNIPRGVTWRNDQTISNAFVDQPLSTVDLKAKQTVCLEPLQVGGYETRSITHDSRIVENANPTILSNIIADRSVNNRLRVLQNTEDNSHVEFGQREIRKRDESSARRQIVGYSENAHDEPGSDDIEQLSVKLVDNLTAVDGVTRSKREVNAAISLTGMVAAATAAAAKMQRKDLRATLEKIADHFTLARRNDVKLVMPRTKKLWQQVMNLRDFR
jgi:hypothetical protein